MTEPLQITTTFDDQTEAKELARKLLEAKLVACAQLSQPSTSLYWWQGEIEEENEYHLVVKTFSHLFEPIVEIIDNEHSYDTPQIIGTPITRISAAYLAWMKEEISK